MFKTGLLMLSILFLAQLDAQPLLLKDCAEGGEPGAGANPTSICGVGKLGFFVTWVSPKSTLWATDGTAPGTRAIKEFVSTAKPDRDYEDEQSAWYAPHALTACGERLFFAAQDGQHGVELWTSDGTPEGTVMVVDLAPGRSHSFPSSMVAARGGVYFIAQGNSPVGALWFSDGTKAGTQIACDLVMRSKLHESGSICLDGAHLWVCALDENFKLTLSRIELATGKDERVKEFGIARLACMDADNGRAWLVIGDRPKNSVLWVSDGTAGGTKEVLKSISDRSFYFHSFTTLAGKTYCVGANGWREGLWTTDGTKEGTQCVREFGYADALKDTGLHLYDWQDRLLLHFFDHGGYADSKQGLWESDGTKEGTKVTRANNVRNVTDVYVLVAGFTAYVFERSAKFEELHVLNQGAGKAKSLGRFASLRNSYDRRAVASAWGQRLLFVGDDGKSGREVWVADAEKAALVADLVVRPMSSTPELLARHGGFIWFTAASTKGGKCLWRTDGTPEGTLLIQRDFYFYEGHEKVMPGPDGRVYFKAVLENSGLSLCISDGTVEGTRAVFSMGEVRGYVSLPLFAGARAVFSTIVDDPDGFDRINNFRAFDPATGKTEIIHNVGMRDELLSSDSFFAPDVYGDRILFRDRDKDGWSLFVTDGTRQNTTKLASRFCKGFITRMQHFALPLNKGVVLLGCEDAKLTLWHSDGTAANTTKLADTNVSADQREWLSPVMVNGAACLMFLEYKDNSPVTCVWRTDGTKEGTQLVETVTGMNKDYGTFKGIRYFATVGQKSIFIRRSGDFEHELYTYDADFKPVLLKDICAGKYGSGTSHPAVVGEKLYFAADDGQGRALWVSDGTTEGTRKFFTPKNSKELSAIWGVTIVPAERGFFFYNWQETGLWYTDGTTEGCVQLARETREYGDTPLFGLEGGKKVVLVNARDSVVAWCLDTEKCAASMVLAPRPVPSRAYFFSARALGPRLWFTLPRADKMVDHWVCDGTVAGTHRVFPEARVSATIWFVLRDRVLLAHGFEEQGVELAILGSRSISLTLGAPPAAKAGETIRPFSEASLNGEAQALAHLCLTTTSGQFGVGAESSFSVEKGRNGWLIKSGEKLIARCNTPEKAGTWRFDFEHGVDMAQVQSLLRALELTGAAAGKLQIEAGLCESAGAVAKSSVEINVE